MKRITTIVCAILAISSAEAQLKQGTVVYTRTTQMQVNFAGMDEHMQQMIPKSRTEKFELVFANNQSLWKQAEQEENDDIVSGGEGGGMQIRMSVAGGNDVLFTDLENKTKVEQREIMDKKFLIDDSVRAMKWKMTGETKNILNHNCMKATTTQISMRMTSTIEDGKIVRQEKPDTALIVAWFASDIPVSTGPGEFQGQLPGLILEMDVSNGRQVFKAVEIKEKADLAVIKAPTGKKRYTPAEYKTERDKMMEEMQRNRGSGQRVIRMN